MGAEPQAKSHQGDDQQNNQRGNGTVKAPRTGRFARLIGPEHAHQHLATVPEQGQHGCEDKCRCVHCAPGGLAIQLSSMVIMYRIPGAKCANPAFAAMDSPLSAQVRMYSKILFPFCSPMGDNLEWTLWTARGMSRNDLHCVFPPAVGVKPLVYPMASWVSL